MFSIQIFGVLLTKTFLFSDLTVSKVIYTSVAGQKIFGVCSSFLCDSNIGDEVSVR